MPKRRITKNKDHPTLEDYCCACGHDRDVMKREVVRSYLRGVKKGKELTKT